MSKSVVLTKKVNKADLQLEYLKAINGIIELTDRELSLLNLLVKFDNELASTPDAHKNVVSAENRKRVKQILGITPDNLSRYISKFKQKGILVKGKVDGEMYVNKSLIPELIKDRVQITIVLKLNNEENNI